MSLRREHEFQCPDCHASFKLEVYSTINATRAPELRSAVMERRFQRHRCDCGSSIGLEPEELSYLDTERKQWIVLMASARLGDWREHEARTQDLFNRALGSEAPAAAQEIGQGISPRLVFGLEGLREKLLIQELGLDDVVIECMKLFAMRSAKIMPARAQELLFQGIEEEHLKLDLVDHEDGKLKSSMGVPRALYAEIASSEDWAGFRAQMGEGPFVDTRRLYFGA
jgi:hypothetical protein